MLENDYFFDCIKLHTIDCEGGDNACNDQSKNGIGALLSLASSVVQQGQIMSEDGTSNVLKLQAGEKIYIAGRFEQNKMDVLESMKNGGDLKDTTIIFPGIT